MILLLASGSATRREMLERAGIAFEVVRPTADEATAKAALVRDRIPPSEVAVRLAELKALSVTAPRALVLGSDQTLEQQDGSLLSKPRSRAEAHEQLRGLGGRRHHLHAAAVLVEDGTVVWSACATAAMSVRSLSEAFIADYLDREYEAVRHNVGCYRIEGLGAQLFDAVEGSHFAILGLPLLPLLAELRRRGVLAS